MKVFSDYGLKDSVTSIIQLLGLFEREVERLYLLNKYKVLRTSLSLFNPSGIFDVYHITILRVEILKILIFHE